MQRTKIETFSHVWNPTTGCSKGCDWCYARRMAHRFKRSFEAQCHPERLEQPLHTRKPARVFVDSAGDLFDPRIPWSFVSDVLVNIWAARQHTFFILTKQAVRMEAFCRGLKPAPNLWYGVSVTNQPDADERIPLLLQTPAAHRFVSVEPLLSHVRLWEDWLPSGTENGAAIRRLGYGHPAISWTIVGAQTGPGAIPPAVECVADLTRQCLDAGVPVFHKDSLAQLPWLADTPGEGRFCHSKLWRRDLP